MAASGNVDEATPCTNMVTKMMEVLEDAEPEAQGHCYNHGGACPYWDTDVQEVERKGGCVLV
eukprot:4651931-Prorocentrum_lima.AAC.1